MAVGTINPVRYAAMVESGAALVSDASLSDFLAFVTPERIASWSVVDGGQQLQPRTVRRSIALELGSRCAADITFAEKLEHMLMWRLIGRWSGRPAVRPPPAVGERRLSSAISRPAEYTERIALDRLWILALAAADNDRNASELLKFTSTFVSAARESLLRYWLQQMGHQHTHFNFDSWDQLAYGLDVLRAGHLLAAHVPDEVASRAVALALACWFRQDAELPLVPCEGPDVVAETQARFGARRDRCATTTRVVDVACAVIANARFDDYLSFLSPKAIVTADRVAADRGGTEDGGSARFSHSLVADYFAVQDGSRSFNRDEFAFHLFLHGNDCFAPSLAFDAVPLFRNGDQERDAWLFAPFAPGGSDSVVADSFQRLHCLRAGVRGTDPLWEPANHVECITRDYPPELRDCVVAEYLLFTGCAAMMRYDPSHAGAMTCSELVSRLIGGLDDLDPKLAGMRADLR
jgi:hypothetical protein